ncbi:MAG: alanine--tRNA ligase [Alphaproteobacteria bacterium]|nr:alanine--tRNA ligase [Alphaproteobacteria bacterium]
MLSSNEIRQTFFDFFIKHQHTLVPSAPIVLKNDPTLLFTNAGMNQFKEYFLGNAKPSHKRLVDTQKCLRVSGKHNDLEEVGVDSYHHTMFEMLGNWSFNDYFKKDAIKYSWELLTDVFQLDKNRLYASVFEGDKNEHIPASNLALKEWQKYLPQHHIIMGNKKDNFWEMGETGPCGPCSEIHYDLRSDAERALTPGESLVNKDHPEVIEIWNNVFIQYNRKKDGSLEKLQAVHVDTGMGLERLVRVIQNKKSNYDTDIFMPTIHFVEKITHLNYNGEANKKDVAFRVVADHIRAIVFTIADGQLPSNTGAGYVIRRILRRAVRYYYSFLNYHQPLLYKLVDKLAEQFKTVFPEVHHQADFIKKVIEEEEHGFLKTLSNGLHKFEDIAKNCNTQNKIDGKLAFELLDTFGFPIDLTRLLAHEKGLHIDEIGFESALQEQKHRSKMAGSMSAEDWIFVKKQTESSQQFLGYLEFNEPVLTHLLQYRSVHQKGKTLYQWVIEKCPFYGESGGQVGDQGWLKFGHETIEVIDTKKENNLLILISNKLPAHISEIVEAQIDKPMRQEITAHHTATHLLQAALKNVLGNHVNQKGSLVTAQHLRFDFTHFAKLTENEIDQVEAIINQKIKANIPVVIKEMPKEQALNLGATALFGEKYGDIVRTVTIDPKFSIELCGGTHVSSTAELGVFVIKHEAAVAAGVRRIEAIASTKAFEYYNEHLSMFHHLNNLFKNPPNLVSSIENLLTENKHKQKYIEQLEHFKINELAHKFINSSEKINDVELIIGNAPVMSVDMLKKIVIKIQESIQKPLYIIIIFAIIDNKMQVAVGTLKGSTKYVANELIKNLICPLIDGSGGGQSHLALAGGTQIATTGDFKATFKNALIEKITTLNNTIL